MGDILYIIVFLVFLLIVKWIVGKILETRRYKIMLNKLVPQINKINIEELSTHLSDINKSYYPFRDKLQQNYKISHESEQIKTIEQYVQEEANYRRLKRRESKEASQRKKWGDY